jgi:peptidoglycan/LPS O-acetylase OafA/YrhL
VVPRVVRIAALLVAAEAVTLLVLAVLEAFAADSDAQGALVTAAFSAIGGLLLLLLARALGRGTPAARSPAVVVQLLMLPIAINLIGPSGRPEWGIPVLVVAVVTLGLLFSPAASSTLHRDLPRD